MAQPIALQNQRPIMTFHVSDDSTSLTESPPTDATASNDTISRRDFLERALIGAAAATLLASCAKEDSGEVAKSDLVLATKRADGSWVLPNGGEIAPGTTLQFGFGKPEAPGILLSIAASGAAKLVAMDAICTHAGCTVQWQDDKKNLHCPCHNSRFDLKGKVLKGPATRPLPLYDVRIEGRDAILTAA